jgi:hypothetical protein
VAQDHPETREELLQHLEKLSGRTLRTREDIQAYVSEMSARKVADEPAVRGWVRAKKITLIALFAFGVVQYYILDVMLEIVSMRTTTYFVPASAPVLKSMLEVFG